MVRISDARMSGTSYGACVLHVAPESYVGGPLALVRDGDLIELDVAARRLDAARSSDDELARRRAAWTAAAAAVRARLRRALPAAHHAGRHGCDFDFLETTRRDGRDGRAGDPLSAWRDAPTRRAPTRARSRMLALLLLATTINYVDRSNLSIVAPFLSKELGLDPVQMGLLFSAFAWSYAIANLPGGYLIDRFGSRMVYGIAQLAWSVATLVLGLVSGFAALFGLRFAVGTRRGAGVPGQQPRRLDLVSAARARPRDVDVRDRASTSARRCSRPCSSGWRRTTAGAPCSGARDSPAS